MRSDSDKDEHGPSDSGSHRSCNLGGTLDRCHLRLMALHCEVLVNHMNNEPRFIDFNSGEDVTEHVIRVDSQEESMRAKAEKFDQIVKDSQYWFSAFTQQHDIAFRAGRIAEAMRFASLGHEHHQVLKLAGIDVLCSCHYCQFAQELVQRSPEKMRLMAMCERVGDSE